MEIIIIIEQVFFFPCLSYSRLHVFWPWPWLLTASFNLLRSLMIACCQIFRKFRKVLVLLTEDCHLHQFYLRIILKLMVLPEFISCDWKPIANGGIVFTVKTLLNNCMPCILYWIPEILSWGSSVLISPVSR